MSVFWDAYLAATNLRLNAKKHGDALTERVADSAAREALEGWFAACELLIDIEGVRSKKSLCSNASFS